MLFLYLHFLQSFYQCLYSPFSLHIQRIPQYPFQMPNDVSWRDEGFALVPPWTLREPRCALVTKDITAGKKHRGKRLQWDLTRRAASSILHLLSLYIQQHY